MSFCGICDAVVGAVVDGANAVAEFGPLRDIATGPLRDFARSTGGKLVLNAIAGSLTGGLAPMLGPQLATVAWAMPGVLRGERFDKAWLQEFGRRTEETATILGGEITSTLTAQFRTSLEWLLANVPVGELVETGVRELADRMGVREDIAEAARTLWNRSEAGLESLRSLAFDPVTGRLPPNVYESGAVYGGAVAHGLTQVQKYAVVAAPRPVYTASVASGVDRASSALASHGGLLPSWMTGAPPPPPPPAAPAGERAGGYGLMGADPAATQHGWILVGVAAAAVGVTAWWALRR